MFIDQFRQLRKLPRLPDHHPLQSDDVRDDGDGEKAFGKNQQLLAQRLSGYVDCCDHRQIVFEDLHDHGLEQVGLV